MGISGLAAKAAAIEVKATDSEAVNKLLTQTRNLAGRIIGAGAVAPIIGAQILGRKIDGMAAMNTRAYMAIKLGGNSLGGDTYSDVKITLARMRGLNLDFSSFRVPGTTDPSELQKQYMAEVLKSSDPYKVIADLAHQWLLAKLQDKYPDLLKSLSEGKTNHWLYPHYQALLRFTVDRFTQIFSPENSPVVMDTSGFDFPPRQRAFMLKSAEIAKDWAIPIPAGLPPGTRYDFTKASMSRRDRPTILPWDMNIDIEDDAHVLGGSPKGTVQALLGYDPLTKIFDKSSAAHTPKNYYETAVWPLIKHEFFAPVGVPPAVRSRIMAFETSDAGRAFAEAIRIEFYKRFLELVDPDKAIRSGYGLQTESVTQRPEVVSELSDPAAKTKFKFPSLAVIGPGAKPLEEILTRVYRVDKNPKLEKPDDLNKQAQFIQIDTMAYTYRGRGAVGKFKDIEAVHDKLAIIDNAVRIAAAAGKNVDIAKKLMTRVREDAETEIYEQWFSGIIKFLPSDTPQIKKDIVKPLLVAYDKLHSLNPDGVPHPALDLKVVEDYYKALVALRAGRSGGEAALGLPNGAFEELPSPADLTALLSTIDTKSPRPFAMLLAKYIMDSPPGTSANALTVAQDITMAYNTSLPLVQRGTAATRVETFISTGASFTTMGTPANTHQAGLRGKWAAIRTELGV